MRATIVSSFVLLIGCPVTIGAPDEALDGLKGTWLAVSCELNGQNLPREKLGTMKLVFEKDKVTWVFGMPKDDKRYDGTYKIDPTKKPKEIDLSQPQNTKVVAKGIYKVEGDTLVVCMGIERPKEFSSKSDTICTLLMFKKQ